QIRGRTAKGLVCIISEERKWLFQFSFVLLGKELGASAGHNYRVAFFPRLIGTSLARRWAVRFRAAARDAFFARAERSWAVIVSRLRLPPIEPIPAIARRRRS